MTPYPELYELALRSSFLVDWRIHSTGGNLISDRVISDAQAALIATMELLQLHLSMEYEPSTVANQAT